MEAEHTPGPGAAASRLPILERKQKPDGSWREYPCMLVHREPGLAIIEFVMARGGEIFDTPLVIPPGSISYGYFWTRRPFNVYRMRTQDEGTGKGNGGRILAHRFDALTEVRISAEQVSYRDLALDWWVLADGTLMEEDRGEFDALVAAGTFSENDVAAADSASRAIYSRYRHIIDDVAAIERKLGLA